MTDNRYESFMLNNSLAAVSVVPFADSFAATDGFECLLHFFDGNATFNRYEKTARAYRRLRREAVTGRITATACCDIARVYFIGEEYNELGFVELETDVGCGDNYNDDMTELTDASLTAIGNECYIVASFRRSAYLFDINGKRLTRLCTAEDNELITDFIHPEQELFAMAVEKNRNRTVTVSDNGKTHSGILDDALSLRMLIYHENAIYGLFGKSYIYNRLIPIYENGVFSLPSKNDFNA